MTRIVSLRDALIFARTASDRDLRALLADSPSQIARVICLAAIGRGQAWWDVLHAAGLRPSNVATRPVLIGVWSRPEISRRPRAAAYQ
jgi:hypothetical protein